MKRQFKRILLVFLIKLTIIPISYAQAEKEGGLPKLNGDFLGVVATSDTIIRIHDYVYVKESRDWQRFTTIIVTNRVFSSYKILKSNKIYVLESDIYVLDFFFTRKTILPALGVDIQDTLFSNLYRNMNFTPEPNEDEIIEEWKRGKKLSFVRYRLDDLKLAVFEVDCQSLNYYLGYSRDIICDSKTVKIGFPISDSFYE